MVRTNEHQKWPHLSTSVHGRLASSKEHDNAFLHAAVMPMGRGSWYAHRLYQALCTVPSATFDEVAICETGGGRACKTISRTS